MTHGFLKSIEIRLPEKTKQIQIGSLLSLVDKNISANHETITRIRGLISLVFHYWFRDFEFPDSIGKPYKSSGGLFRDFGDYPSQLPVDFSLEPLAGSQIMKLIPPGVEEFSGERNYLATAQVADYRINSYPSRVTYLERESRADMSPRRNSAWFAKMKNTKKFLFFGPYSIQDLEKYILSTGFAGLEIDDDYFEYILSIIDDDFFEKVKDNMSVGATQEAINLLAMKQILLPIPPRALAKKYKEFSADLYKAFYQINSQSEKLEKLRNSLVTGLMSGSMLH
jgi:type I restriction enzyme S subunit